MSDHSGFREWKVMLCLNKELYRAFIKVQADKDLGRSYAGLLPFVEGLYHMGYIAQDVYEKNVKHYSEPLIKKEEVPESPEQKQARVSLESEDTIFKETIAQFSLHAQNSQWLLKWQQKAEKFQSRLDSARTLLSMISSVTSDKATVQ